MRMWRVYAASGAAGAVAFLAAHDWATAWRGYEAVGGEFLLLLLPLWVWVAEMLVTDWREERGCEEVRRG